MSLGAMRDKIEIQSKERVPDGRGGFTSSWVSRGLIWGEVMEAKASTRFEAMKLEQEITHEVHIRHRVNIQRLYRLIFVDETGERFLEVETVRAQDNRRRFTEVLCRETKP